VSLKILKTFKRLLRIKEMKKYGKENADMKKINGLRFSNNTLLVSSVYSMAEEKVTLVLRFNPQFITK